MNFSICCFQLERREVSLIDFTAIISLETYSIRTSSPVIRSLSVFTEFSFVSIGWEGEIVGTTFFSSRGIALIGAFFSYVGRIDCFFERFSSVFEVIGILVIVDLEEFWGMSLFDIDLSSNTC